LPASGLDQNVCDRPRGRLPVRGHQQQGEEHRPPAPAVDAKHVLAQAAHRAREDYGSIAGRPVGHRNRRGGFILLAWKYKIATIEAAERR